MKSGASNWTGCDFPGLRFAPSELRSLKRPWSIFLRERNAPYGAVYFAQYSGTDHNSFLKAAKTTVVRPYCLQMSLSGQLKRLTA